MKNHRPTSYSAIEPSTAYISPSRLRLWLKCPLAYKLRYIDGIRTPATPNMLLGKAVHAGLEFYYRHRQRGVTLFPRIVTDYIGEAWELFAAEEGTPFESPERETLLKEQACQLVDTYLTQLPNDEGIPIAVEKQLTAILIDPCTGERMESSLTGILDLVILGPGGVSIVDFKTAARSSTQLDVLYELQLSCYSYLLRHACGLSEDRLEIRSLIRTKTPKVEIHKFDTRREQHFARLFSVIRAYENSLRESSFFIRPGIECSFCDYRPSRCTEFAGDGNLALAG